MKNKRMYRHLWVLGCTIVLTGTVFFFADMPLARFFEVNHNHVLTWLGECFSLVGESQWYLVPSGLIGIFCWRWRPAWSRKGWYVFMSVASTGILANLIKVCSGRYRPRVYFEQGIAGFSPFRPKIDELAFPSGHATTAFAAAVALGYLFPRFRCFFYAVAALVAVSRVVLVRHWLSDAIAGAWLGTVGAVLCWTWMMGGQGETHAQK